METNENYGNFLFHKRVEESRDNCRHFLGAAAAAVKSRRLFSLPHVDNRIRISDADTKVEKKLKIEFFFSPAPSVPFILAYANEPPISFAKKEPFNRAASDH